MAICNHCSTSFKAKRPDAKFCSARCRKAVSRTHRAMSHLTRSPHQLSVTCSPSPVKGGAERHSRWAWLIDAIRNETGLFNMKELLTRIAGCNASDAMLSYDDGVPALEWYTVSGRRKRVFNELAIREEAA